MWWMMGWRSHLCWCHVTGSIVWMLGLARCRSGRVCDCGCGVCNQWTQWSHLWRARGRCLGWAYSEFAMLGRWWFTSDVFPLPLETAREIRGVWSINEKNIPLNIVSTLIGRWIFGMEKMEQLWGSGKQGRKWNRKINIGSSPKKRCIILGIDFAEFGR